MHVLGAVALELFSCRRRRDFHELAIHAIQDRDRVPGAKKPSHSDASNRRSRFRTGVVGKRRRALRRADRDMRTFPLEPFGSTAGMLPKSACTWGRRERPSRRPVRYSPFTMSMRPRLQHFHPVGRRAVSAEAKFILPLRFAGA